MEQDRPLLSRIKTAITSNKNVLALVASSILTILCLILVFTMNHWLAKGFFLLIAIGAALFSLLLLESLRILQKYTKSKPLPKDPAPVIEDKSPDPAESVITEEPVEADEAKPLPSENDVQTVYISEKGNKYHHDKSCAGLRFADVIQEVSKEEAVSLGREACSRCQAKDMEIQCSSVFQPKG